MSFGFRDLGLEEILATSASDAVAELQAVLQTQQEREEAGLQHGSW